MPKSSLSIYIPTDRRRALANGITLQDRAVGAALFADISGFSPLTEALLNGLGSQRGAEELTRHLNAAFETLISEVSRFGGSVVGFSGDAVTCWFDGDNGLRATACALEMQKNITTLQGFTSPGGDHIAFALKAAVAVGEVRRFCIGVPNEHLLDVLAGKLLDELALAESLARRDDVILAPSAISRLSDQADIAPIRRPGQSKEEQFGVVKTLNVEVAAGVPEIVDLEMPEEQVRAWLPGPVYQRLSSGGEEYLAELRPAVALFLRFTGINYEQEDARELLDVFIQRVQHILLRHEATLLDVTIGDKGSYFYAAFGAPIAHEDDPLRAVTAGLEMQALVDELDAIEGIQIGISQGLMRVGTYGASTRGTYGVHGNDVNIAARLMTLAEPGQILITERVRQAVSHRFQLDSRGMLPIRGHDKPLPLYVVTPAKVGVQATKPSTSPLIGRNSERERLSGAIRTLLQGEGSRFLIEGEAGIGKTRLVGDLLERAEGLNIPKFVGAGNSIERETPFHAWRRIFSELFGLSGGGTSPTDAAAVLERFSAKPEWHERAPLLGSLLSLPIEDNAYTAEMTGDLRSENTLELLFSILSSEIHPAPAVLVIEDVHWLDSASWALLDKVNSEIDTLLIVLTARPEFTTPNQDLEGIGDQIEEEYERFRADPRVRHINLESLPPDDISAIITQRLGAANLPKVVTDLIRRLGEGNPLFSEEIALMLREEGFLEIRDGRAELKIDTGELETIDFPETLHGVIASRLDTLPADQILTLKVASVIGRSFPFRTLHAVHPSELSPDTLKIQLEDLHRREITPVESPEPDLAYIFKNSLTQEVVYQHLLFSQRQKLHRELAVWYEAEGANTVHVNRIAHHLYEAVREGEVDPALTAKALEHLESAGDQALQQSAYREAVTMFSRAIGLVSQMDRAPQWRRGETEPISAALPDQRMQARWIAKMGEAYRGWGRFSKGQAYLEKAAREYGQAVPSSILALMANITLEVVRQGIARLRPTRKPDGGDRSRALELSRIYQHLGEMYFFSNQKVKSLYTIVKTLNMSEKAGSSPEYAGALAAMSLTTGLFGLHSQAEHYYHRASEIANEANHSLTSAEVWRVNGLYRIGIGEWEKAKIDLAQALEIHDRLRDTRHAGDCRTLLCHIEYSQGNFKSSAAMAAELVAIGEKDENPALQIWGLYQQGASLLRLGDPRTAVQHANGALTLISEHAEGAAEIYTLGILALAHWRQGDAERAKEVADHLAESIGETRGIPSAYNVLDGYIAAAEIYLGLWDEGAKRDGDGLEKLKRTASKSYKALHMFRRLFPIGAPSAWRYQGRYEWLSGRGEQARRSWETSLQRSIDLGMQYEEGLAHAELGRHLPADDSMRAEHLRQAGEIFRRLNTPYELALVKGEK